MLNDLQDPNTLERVPVSVASRLATAWSESLEGSMAGDGMWALLARYRSRLLLPHSPADVDRNTEIKRRLNLWERGQFDDLVQTVVGQQAEAERQRRPTEQSAILRESEAEERQGKRARQKTAGNAVRKAVQGLVGGVAAGTDEERARWATEYIPRSSIGVSPCASVEEADAAKACAWGQGNVQQARREMRSVGRRPGEPQWC